MESVRVFILRTGICLLAIILGMVACSEEKKSTAPTDDCTDVITVTGEVVEIVDLTPVDGGVILKIIDEKDDIYEMDIGSPFITPWTEEEEQLYWKLSELEAGSRIRATGCELENGIKLLDIEILD